MRGRAIGLGLLGLGAFALVGALLIHLLVVPAAVKLPLAEESHPTAGGTGVDWFSAHDGQQFTGETATVKEDVVGQPDSPDANGDVAVWKVQSVMRDSSDRVITMSTYTVCLDRRTAMAVSDCASARSDHGTISGLTLNFPFGTEQKTYSVYDGTAGRAFPAKFQAVQKMRGLTVYRFEQDVPETVVATQSVPGNWAGADAGTSVDADFVYSSTRTYWVEPTTGMILSLQEKPHIVVRGPDGTTGVTWLDGTFVATDEQISKAAQDASDNRSNIVMIGSVVPWVLVGVGVVALLIGALLATRTGGRREDDLGEPTTSARVPQVQ
jgi:hypothetical protein